MIPVSWPEGLGPVLCIVGARPNFMKMAPILRAFATNHPVIPTLLVHTGQHYDREMNDQLFEDLRLPRPDINLDVGSGTHAVRCPRDPGTRARGAFGTHQGAVKIARRTWAMEADSSSVGFPSTIFTPTFL